jgi:hypothetical protein
MADNFLEATLGRTGDYLPDGAVAMAVLDRLVERAIILKVEGESYRARRPKGGENPA